MVDMKFILLILPLIAGFSTGKGAGGESDKRETSETDRTGVATFAGGCFWCTEADFEKLPGVIRVVSGYTGGETADPTYRDVCSGKTGHLEAVQVYFNPDRISYGRLLEIFWRTIDPTDEGGQFVDRGAQYRSAIFYHDEEQKREAEMSKIELDSSGIFDRPVVTEIRSFTRFWEAEDYHQGYYRECLLQYGIYRAGSGRDEFMRKIWGSTARERISLYSRPTDADIRKNLDPLQFKVTQECGTEPPFENEYWDNKREGIYVDIVSGEPLFSSLDKYDSGSGWPSFSRPLVDENIIEKQDSSHSMIRTEVRSRHAESHLGHLFKDGPAPTGLRYCINSASIRFIPKENLKKEGYGEYLNLFE